VDGLASVVSAESFGVECITEDGKTAHKRVHEVLLFLVVVREWLFRVCRCEHIRKDP
jgi:hypothetical protein